MNIEDALYKFIIIIIILIQTLVGLVLLRFLNLLTPWLVIRAQVLVELTFFISCLATPSKTSILKYVCCVIKKSSTIPRVYIGYELATIISYSTSTSETIIVYICKDAPRILKTKKWNKNSQNSLAYTHHICRTYGLYTNSWLSHCKLCLFYGSFSNSLACKTNLNYWWLVIGGKFIKTVETNESFYYTCGCPTIIKKISLFRGFGDRETWSFISREQGIFFFNY